MKIVIDTNVLISAFIGSGISHQVLEHCARHHEIITSTFILNELHQKLTGKFKYTSEIAGEAIEILKSRSYLVTPSPISPICRDADDDAILATAITGQCALIITGDKDLLVLRKVENVTITNPATFARDEGVL